VAPLEDAAADSGPSNVVDLTELLVKSLGQRKRGTAPTARAKRAAPARKRA
jgi:non-homologous end joining protein Ku